ncbi:type II toxin-antitoxin system HicB family antitoxin [Telmatobacter bradus]|uniref:type II toxin-antitoxin system HicB family antitoxin n=1 Tax=Telmatobacter bradus TaxID=474953 RepID=UPI003B42A120
MRYPVNLDEAEEGGYVVTFPDIPEAITQGEDVDDALLHAADALESALDFYFEDQRPVPAPSRAKRGQHGVELSPSLSSKVLLLNEMLAQKVRPAELARRMDTTPQEVNRLTNIRHNTRIDRVDQALRALGKRLEVRVV